MNEPNFRKLNQIFSTDQKITDMINFINSNRTQFPANVNQNKYLNDSQMFNVQNNSLFYIQNNHNLEVIPKANAEQLIRNLYQNIQTGFGKSIQTFYYYIKNNYLNISRKQVSDALKTIPIYNATRPKMPEQRFTLRLYKKSRDAMVLDLLDCSDYGNRQQIPNGAGQTQKPKRYILVIVDVFSKYVFLKYLQDKQQNTVRNAIQNLILNDPNLRPRHVISDNGNEFRNDLLNNLFAQYNISREFTYPHHPNAWVERVNRNIRKLIREMFLRRNNRQYADDARIEEIKNAINNTMSLTTNKTPNELFNLNANDPKVIEVANKVRKRNEEIHSKYKNQEVLQVNTPVLVRLEDANQNQMAKAKKEDMFYKNKPFRWSSEHYFINTVVNQRISTGYTKYSIKNANNQILRNNQNKIMYLKRESLMPVPTEQEDYQRNNQNFTPNQIALIQQNKSFLNRMRNLNQINNPKQLNFA